MKKSTIEITVFHEGNGEGYPSMERDTESFVNGMRYVTEVEDAHYQAETEDLHLADAARQNPAIYERLVLADPNHVVETLAIHLAEMKRLDMSVEDWRERYSSLSDEVILAKVFDFDLAEDLINHDSITLD